MKLPYVLVLLLGSAGAWAAPPEVYGLKLGMNHIEVVDALKARNKNLYVTEETAHVQSYGVKVNTVGGRVAHASIRKPRGMPFLDFYRPSGIYVYNRDKCAHEIAGQPKKTSCSYIARFVKGLSQRETHVVSLTFIEDLQVAHGKMALIKIEFHANVGEKEGFDVASFMLERYGEPNSDQRVGYNYGYESKYGVAVLFTPNKGVGHKWKGYQINLRSKAPKQVAFRDQWIKAEIARRTPQKTKSKSPF